MRRKRVLFQKTFKTSPLVNRNFRMYSILFVFGQWNQSKEFPHQLAFRGSKVHPLKRKIYRQRICFLFVDWSNWKFFFFCGRNVSCLICFFLPLKKNASNCIVASQKNECKSNNETNLVWAKKLQYGWVSECWLWYDIGWTLKVIVNETQVLRTSPDT